MALAVKKNNGTVVPFDGGVIDPAVTVLPPTGELAGYRNPFESVELTPGW